MREMRTMQKTGKLARVYIICPFYSTTTPEFTAHIFGVLLLSSLTELPAQLAPSTQRANSLVTKLEPTWANVPYGRHERNILDFYQAKSALPTPVVIYIHPGGWYNGDKTEWILPEPYLAAGISVVAINYRFVTMAGDLSPPVRAPYTDAMRALQFVRSKSKEWNLDKTRIAVTGTSAGACSALWLACHSDMEDPKSSDPIARESTRLFAVAVNDAQTTLDPKQMKEWTPNSNYGAHAFGIKG
jgi:acetyl esterase/lipase